MARQTKQRSHKRWMFKILLPIGSILTTCLIFEAVLRFIGYYPFKDLLDGRELVIRPSAIQERLYEAAPNTEGYIWGTKVSINSFGFRDKKYDTKIRIALIVFFVSVIQLHLAIPYQSKRHFQNNLKLYSVKKPEK